MTEPWRIETWTISGVHTGYRVVRGAGASLVVDCSHAFDRYRPGDHLRILRNASERCGSLNAV